MDLRGFYKKIREAEAAIASDPVLVVSHATPDGGKAGVITEVASYAAARLLVEGKARLATLEESTGYRAKMDAALQRAQAEISKGVQLAVLSDSVLESLRAIFRPHHQPVAEPEQPAQIQPAQTQKKG